ncbi:winged helix-turn-helix domain-containing protein [Methyloversatilis discipulorum]|jgi:DNA-binding response OmpR family regulator|uniref:winged helix-turn-helix domain-containing protein n=1 Tax=Methyloversatilis discipulorum TaxID=1119528 RepID=UPI000DB6FA8B|nr:winged helix-turn-helix domain-containing protein [Methyloversatilis sp.]PZU54037.1 MAG: DNA-binding response regulator [Thauera sp.]
MRLLLATDDQALRGRLTDELDRHWYCVDGVLTRSELNLALTEYEWGGLLVGPSFDGQAVGTLLGVLKSKLTGVPVVALLDARGHLGEALDAGADDAMTVPPDIDELLARLRAFDRRRVGGTDSLLATDAVAIDLAACCAVVGERRIPLKRREFQILKHLITHAGRPVSARSLHDHVYGWSEDVVSNALHVHIHNLRRKLPAGVIVTVRGVGFMMHGRRGALVRTPR